MIFENNPPVDGFEREPVLFPDVDDSFVGVLQPFVVLVTQCPQLQHSGDIKATSVEASKQDDRLAHREFLIELCFL